VDPLILQKQADCISTMTYNEYWQVIDAGIPAEDLIVFKYEDQGVATLEDGLYVLESAWTIRPWSTSWPGSCKASMKGWAYAAENPEEAADDRA
jgi:NitT/TauT family transport system substrate-binding protein